MRIQVGVEAMNGDPAPGAAAQHLASQADAHLRDVQQCLLAFAVLLVGLAILVVLMWKARPECPRDRQVQQI